MNKITTALLLTILYVSGCAQEVKDKVMSSGDRISYLSEKVRRFNQEPLYQLEVESVLSFSILMNGCPVYSNFDQRPGMARVDINPYILKSGQQQVTIALYPGYDGQGTVKQYLENGSKFSLKIEKTGWDKGGNLKTPEEIVLYKTANETTDLAKLKTYKKDIHFKADVPYQLEGWTNGQDLTQLDRVQLEQQVLSFYRQMLSAFENKEDDDLNTKFLKADAEWCQALYFPKDIITKFQTTKGRKGKSVATTLSTSTRNSRTFYSLQNYDLKFYGDGRLVRLESREGANRGESLLGYEDIDKNGLNRKTFVDMLLYMPKGSNSLEIIR